jgi:hypothetical protein
MTKIRTGIAAIVAGTLVSFATTSWAATTDQPGVSEKSQPQAVIHFADHGEIKNWQADGPSAIYIEDTERHWYHAQLMFPCRGLQLDDRRVGFESEPNGDFDNLSFIAVGHERCQVQSLIQSTKPAGAMN